VQLDHVRNVKTGTNLHKGANYMSSSIWSQDHYLAVVRFAAEAHNGQLVPGTDLPYLLHLNLVAMEVIAALPATLNVDAELAVAAALLHDVIEDTSVTYGDVAVRFGTAIADGVLALTKNAAVPKEQQMGDSLQRIRAQPSAIWMVKLADRITNLQPPPAHWTAERIGRYRDEAIVILSTLGEASQALAERLRAKIGVYGASGA
jgi:(p)ppGpp synthase/HD superfamily hydrolase